MFHISNLGLQLNSWLLSQVMGAQELASDLRGAIGRVSCRMTCRFFKPPLPWESTDHEVSIQRISVYWFRSPHHHSRSQPRVELRLARTRWNSFCGRTVVPFVIFSCLFIVIFGTRMGNRKVEVFSGPLPAFQPASRYLVSGYVGWDGTSFTREMALLVLVSPLGYYWTKCTDTQRLFHADGLKQLFFTMSGLFLVDRFGLQPSDTFRRCPRCGHCCSTS